MSKNNFNQNWGIIGHERVVEFLRGNITRNNVGHAYLFVGPKFIGKKTIAKKFAAALICEEKNKPCGQCQSCRQFAAGLYSDISFIKKTVDPKTKKERKNISLEQIRELKDRLSKSSLLNSYKIAIIEDAEDLSLEAANGLLKTLEEPAEKTVLILLTTNEKLLPVTILSRCQKLILEPISEKLIYDYLISLNCSRNLAESLAAVSAGRPGRALDYYQNPTVWADYQLTAKNFLELVGAPDWQKLKAAAGLVKTDGDFVAAGQNLNRLMDVWSGVLRDILLLQKTREEIPAGLINRWLLNDLKNSTILKKETARILAWLKEINQAKIWVGQNLSPQLILENLFLRLE